MLIVKKVVDNNYKSTRKLNLLIVTISIVFFDQLSKILIKNLLFQHQQINIIGNFLKFTYVENSGIAFGINTSDYHIYVTILTLLAISILIYYRIKLKDECHHEKIPLSLIIGGAIGNVIDRILVLIPSSGYNGVIDFIDIGFNHYRWYIFNIADSAITIGVILYFIFQYKYDKKDNAESRDI